MFIQKPRMVRYLAFFFNTYFLKLLLFFSSSSQWGKEEGGRYTTHALSSTFVTFAHIPLGRAPMAVPSYKEGWGMWPLASSLCSHRLHESLWRGGEQTGVSWSTNRLQVLPVHRGNWMHGSKKGHTKKSGDVRSQVQKLGDGIINSWEGVTKWEAVSCKPKEKRICCSAVKTRLPDQILRVKSLNCFLLCDLGQVVNLSVLHFSHLYWWDPTWKKEDCQSSYLIGVFGELYELTY